MKGREDMDTKYRAIPKYPDRDQDSLKGMHYYDGTFVYGYLVDGYIVGPVVEATSEYINFEYWIPIDKETISQYTGYKDEEGRRIYQGDILRYVDYHAGSQIEGVCIGEAIFEEGGWHLTNSITENILHWYEGEHIEIIGDIHGSPELLRLMEAD